MIPENSTMGDPVDKETELGSSEQPHSPASTSSQESKLQKLKKSLSFKTKSVRSKSVDNLFQRTNSDMKLQVELDPEDCPTSTIQIQTSESQHSTPTKVPQQVDNKAHILQEHVFKKPTFCDVCNHMIVGTHAKHGLRCKACKMSIHHRCTESTGFQRCMGKLPKGFQRYYSSPLLIHEQFGCIKEVMPIACGNKVDPVYETLRFGTSLAQKNKKSSSGSGSDSPNMNSAADLAEVPEEGDNSFLLDLSRERRDSVFTYLENGTETFREDHQQKSSNSMGRIDERIGFFPANFVQKVQKNEKLFRCCRTFIGCKEQGQITIKENQICTSLENENNGFIKVTTGKKKGFVPLDVLENI
ncbi:SH3 and cysteine-rich domain-containing protein isoform X2 [Pelobates fuscus]|uniref:SH3 and cysteine-rich domain-containing protein isoform X2 n=1 Tax=Pelobates fuscus TaxID=191477 RepID=UPI002FE47202